jgi:outer membrane protein assembly factor BamD
MSPRLLFVFAGSAVLFASCAKDDVVPLAGQSAASRGDSESLYQRAKQADESGNRKKAIKLYDQAADKSPSAPNSAQARYRQAELLQQSGETVKAFDAYQQFLEKYQHTGLYSKALSAQAAMADEAAKGNIKTSFLGLKSGLSLERVTSMLEKVRDNAPKSATASKAQFRIGELYQGEKKDKEAIEAFRKVVREYPDRSEAPEAQFRIGKVYLDQAQRGNQNQATLNLAKEAFQDYLTQFPGHSRNGEARRLMSELGGRSVQRTFDVAEFYLKTGEVESAKVYYREVLRRAGSGDLHNRAKARLAELGEG